jgi:hypothetical protein
VPNINGLSEPSPDANAGANANARTNDDAGAEAGDDDCIILEHSGVDVKVLSTR